MAIRIDTNGEYLRRTAGLLDYNSAYTRAGFVYLTADLNNYGHFFVSDDGAGDFTDYDHCGLDADGTTFRVEACAAGACAAAAGAALSLNTWYFVGMRRSDATTYNGFVIPLSTLAISSTANVATNVGSRVAIAGMECGDIVGGGGGGYRISGRLAGLKEWSAYLSDAELIREAATLAPQRRANLHAWFPCVPGAGRHRDYSGAGIVWSENGTLSDEDGPPVAPPYSGDGEFSAWVVAAGGSPQTVAPGGIVSAEAFGAARLNLLLALAGVGSGETFGAPAVAPGPVTLAPGGVPSAEAFGAVTIAPGVALILPAGMASAEAFGLAAVSGGAAAADGPPFWHVIPEYFERRRHAH